MVQIQLVQRNFSKSSLAVHPTEKGCSLQSWEGEGDERGVAPHLNYTVGSLTATSPTRSLAEPAKVTTALTGP